MPERVSFLPLKSVYKLISSSYPKLRTSDSQNRVTKIYWLLLNDSQVTFKWYGSLLDKIFIKKFVLIQNVWCPYDFSPESDAFAWRIQENNSYINNVQRTNELLFMGALGWHHCNTENYCENRKIFDKRSCRDFKHK